MTDYVVRPLPPRRQDVLRSAASALQTAQAAIARCAAATDQPERSHALARAIDAIEAASAAVQDALRASGEST